MSQCAENSDRYIVEAQYPGRYIEQDPFAG